MKAPIENQYQTRFLSKKIFSLEYFNHLLHNYHKYYIDLYLKTKKTVSMEGMAKLGFSIKKIRELRSLTQKQVSDRLGITQGNYARLEKGEIKISEKRLSLLAQILDTSPMRIHQFDAEIVFPLQSYISANAETGNIVSDQILMVSKMKQMYENRISHLEGYINSLKTEMELLKS